MSVLLIKDEEEAKQIPIVFEIKGQGISLFGEIPPANNPGYAEDWKKMIGATPAIKPSGDFARETVESKLTLPGKPEVAVTGGSLSVEAFTGKWAGSNGDRTLKGKIRLQLKDGRTLEGTFSVHAVTWG